MFGQSSASKKKTKRNEAFFWSKCKNFWKKLREWTSSKILFFNFQENELDYDGNSQLRVILTKNKDLFFLFPFFCAYAEVLERNFRVSLTLITFVFIFSLIEELAYSVLKTSATEFN